jgi:hypothetical protein
VGKGPSEDKILEQFEGDQSRIFERGYDPLTEKIILANITAISDETRQMIEDAYARFGGADAVLEARKRKERVDAITDPAQRKERVICLAQELYGPLLTSPEHLFKTLGLDATSSTVREKLNKVLKDSVSEKADSVAARQRLRSALYRMILIKQKTEAAGGTFDGVAFLEDALGAVDYKKVAEVKDTLEKNKQRIEAGGSAAKYFENGDHKKIKTKFADIKAVVTDPTNNIAKDSPFKVQKVRNQAELEIAKSNKGKKGSQGQSANMDAYRDAHFKAQMLEEIVKDDIVEQLKTLAKHLKTCQKEGVSVAGLPTTDLQNFINAIGGFGNNYSFDALNTFFAGKYGGKTPEDILNQINGESVAKELGEKTAPLEDENRRLDKQLASFRGKVEKNMDVTDEDLAVRINSYILSQNDATKDLPNDEKKKFAKAILARDLTVMDNDDYFERMARNVNVAAIADAVMKDKVLKFDIGITDAEGTVKSTLKPLQRVQAENLRTINDINVAVQFKRIDWMAAFVLFMSLEQLGEKGSDRCEHLKKTAKELLAKEMGLDPYDQQVEEAFEDQIVKLKPYIEDYYKKSAEARDTTENQSSQMLVDSIHAWLKEALKMEEIGETDFELVMKDLEDMGYFKAKRKLADGTVGIMPKDQALAYLKAMFKDTLKEQEKEDRKHYLEEASKKSRS